MKLAEAPPGCQPKFDQQPANSACRLLVASAKLLAKRLQTKRDIFTPCAIAH